MRFSLLVIAFYLIQETALTQDPSSDHRELTYAKAIKTGPIAGAIFSNPALGDFNGDGTMDLILGTKHFGAGIDFYQGNQFQNDTRIFEAPIRLDLAHRFISAADWNHDGLMDLLARSERLELHINRGGTPPRFEDALVLDYDSETQVNHPVHHATTISSKASHILITGHYDFEDHWPMNQDQQSIEIGFWQGYDASGKWKGVENLVNLRWWQSLSEEKSILVKPMGYLRAEHTLIRGLNGVSPISVDVDRDGDKDLVIANFIGDFSWAQNTGSNINPRFRDSVQLQDLSGHQFRSPQCFVQGQGIDWNNDGWEDLVFGCEDAFVYVSLNQQSQTGSPAFKKPTRIQAKRPPLDLGVAACPWWVDLDSDGSRDLLVGNAAGQIIILGNTETDQSPAFDLGNPIEVDGQPFRLQAGYSGSVQGPAEATWGYIAPSTFDVDQDGDQDILYSSINGYHEAIMNKGSAQTPQWTQSRSINVNGTPLRTVWRTRPIMEDWNHDDIADYICLNEKGFLGHYLGDNQQSWNSFSEWVPWEFSNGTPIDPGGLNGMEGRAKFCLTDWDR
ncbi:VCBS repeat-containing protein, partial [Verrucomicrobia bacterium]|nr:VCBS repeat-containing protein [Verrucomicrobiota bacterium]